MNSYDQGRLVDILRDVAESLSLIDARMSWFQRFFQALHPDVVVPPPVESSEHEVFLRDGVTQMVRPKDAQ